MLRHDIRTMTAAFCAYFYTFSILVMCKGLGSMGVMYSISMSTTHTNNERRKVLDAIHRREEGCERVIQIGGNKGVNKR